MIRPEREMTGWQSPAELVRQHEADTIAICERKMIARAYLDAGRAG